ncbi:MAG: gamma-glutamyl-gamma-aminobutyrate hydrolase family protein [Oligoflexales bacterium]
MPDYKPLKIGISSCIMHKDAGRPLFKNKVLLYAEQTLVYWVMNKRDLAFVIPRLPDYRSMKDYVAAMDGIVLHGGADVSPSSYNEKPLRPEWSGDIERDVFEKALIKAAIDLNKPVLGICRGLQIMNVAMGGSLYQDIATQVEGAHTHRSWDKYEDLHHEVDLTGDKLKNLYHATHKSMVNSIHHQAIKDLAQDFSIEAQSSTDKIIESILYKGKKHQDRFLMGVQWHPEFHGDNNHLLGDQVLLEYFLDAIRTIKAN